MTDGYRDGVRILVAGGTTVDESVQDFARRFGKHLMSFTRPEVVLLTGGAHGADAATVRGAREELNRTSPDQIEHRIVTFPDPKSEEGILPAFVGTRVVQTKGRTKQRRRFAMAAAAHAVVAIGGSKGTPEIVALARALEIPVLPLPFTGGAAGRMWTTEEEREDIDESCRRFGIDESTRVRWLHENACQDPGSLAKEAAELTWRGATSDCFVALRYGVDDDKVWQRIEAAVNAAGLRAVRSDEHAVPGEVWRQMQERIRNARVVVGYLTDERPRADGRGPVINPNVMYEVGFAHALGRPVVIVHGLDTELPVDLSGHLKITYVDTDGFSAELTRQLESVRASSPP
ncbi:MAG: hypothetical protein ABWZ15_12555 [Acidimicrobiia bacterium]